jgi:hypothetical protein
MIPKIKVPSLISLLTLPFSFSCLPFLFFFLHLSSLSLIFPPISLFFFFFISPPFLSTSSFLHLMYDDAEIRVLQEELKQLKGQLSRLEVTNGELWGQIAIKVRFHCSLLLCLTLLCLVIQCYVLCCVLCCVLCFVFLCFVLRFVFCVLRFVFCVLRFVFCVLCFVLMIIF